MPIRAGEAADLLRAVGRLLDSFDATTIQLLNGDAFLTISWQTKQGGPDERQYEERNLEDLRRWARDSRGDIQKGPPGGLADMLRTLGQDLDRERIELTQVEQDAEGLTVVGSLDGRSVRRRYLTLELRASSQRRREWRQEEPSSPRGPDTLRVPPRTEEPRRPPDDEGPLARRLRRS